MPFAPPPDARSIVPRYKCGTPDAPSICYATDADQEGQFRAIQALANAFAPVVGFSPLAVDGRIGPATVSALQLVARKLLEDPTTSALGGTLGAISATKEVVAASLASVHQMLVAGIERLHLTNSTGSTPSPQPPAPAPAPLPLPPPPRANGNQSPEARRSWMPWVLGGGILAAAALGAVVILTRPPPRRFDELEPAEQPESY